MTGFDLSTISAVYVGDTPYSEIYYGSTKIWPAAQHDYSRDYLTFEVLESGTFAFTKSINYSTNNGSTWTSLPRNTNTPTINAGNKILWKAELTPLPDAAPPDGIGIFSSTGEFNVMGNVMSLLYGDNFVGQVDLTGKDYVFYELFYNCINLINAENLSLPATTLVEGCYTEMFRGCTSLTTVPELPVTTLAKDCYSSMFRDCTTLTTTPALPATTLAKDCYSSMFWGCTSLTTAPALPATTLANYCYEYMFSGCTSLTTTPALPVTTLTLGCYMHMFYGCTSLTTAPELPATTLADRCYHGMFYGCTSLTTAPALPATTLTLSCYSEMFRGCTSLTTAPELPATTLANSCYYEMFYGCYALTEGPELPATTLADGCYFEMFRYCTSLTTAPALPATTLATECYYGMFRYCTSLTTAPTLPATTLARSCYLRMFEDCTSLNSVTCNATDISASLCLGNWLNNVAATGDFYKDANTTYPTGISGIPSGWTTHNIIDYSREYFTIESLEDNNEISFVRKGSVYRTIDISTDNGVTWISKASSTSPGTLLATLNTGDKLLVKGSNTSYSTGTLRYSYFSPTKTYNVYGNIMSLIYGDNFIGQTSLSSNYTFVSLFGTTIIDASNLILPATTLTKYCYYGMFEGCTSLTTAPELPATILANSCYQNMFNSCFKLTTAPELPATTLTNSCYYQMFTWSKITSITCHATDISATNCLTDWLNNVAATGNFYKDANTTYPTGASGIPSGWTTHNIN